MLNNNEPAQTAPGRGDAFSIATQVAPLWHTLLVAIAVMVVSVLGMRIGTHSAVVATHHVREYLYTLGWEWALAVAVLWGLWLGGTPVRVLLGGWPSSAKSWLEDAGIAVAFWASSALVLAMVSELLRVAHFKLPARTISALAPSSVAELMLFLVLSLSAGCCEELLFRGYFQQQFSYLARGRVWVGVAASSLLFGCAHLYEGATGVVLITIFGAMFSLLAVKRQSLRPGIMAHAWHDGVSGLLLFLLQRSHILS